MFYRDCECPLCVPILSSSPRAKSPPTLGDILAGALDGVKRPTVPVVKRVPRGLSSLRKSFIDYYENPAKFIDMNTLRPRYEGVFEVDAKSMQEVTGLTHIGEGAYSDVYEIDDKRVLKVVKDEDSGYARFVATIKGKSNPHYPRIFYSSVWAGKTVYIIEKLTSQPENGNRKLRDQFISAIRAGNKNPFLTHANKHVAEASALMLENDLDGDLGRDNLLFRGNVPVISDPCCD